MELIFPLKMKHPVEIKQMQETYEFLLWSSCEMVGIQTLLSYTTMVVG